MNAPKQQRRGRIPKAPRVEPHLPAEWDPEDAHAIQAVYFGRAGEAQQKRAFQFLLHNICGLGDLSYRPGDPEATAFAEGKRFVGLQLAKFAQLNIARVGGKHTEQGEAPKEQPK